jgi:hypothetical protein
MIAEENQGKESEEKGRDNLTRDFTCSRLPIRHSEKQERGATMVTAYLPRHVRAPTAL